MTNEQNKLADDGTFTSYADLPDGVRKHLLDLEVFIGEVDGKETVITLSDETCVDNGTLDSSDAVVAFNGIVAALRAAGEPVACAQCGANLSIGRCWEIDEGVYFCNVCLPDEPAPSASVPVEVWHGDRQVAIYDAEVIRVWGTDMVNEMSSSPRTHESVGAAFDWLYAATPSPLMAAGEAAPQASAESAQPTMSEGRYWTNQLNACWDRSMSDALKTAAQKALNYIENTEGELGMTLSCGDALRSALAARTSPHPSRIDAAARASETVEATSPAKRDYAARVMRDWVECVFRFEYADRSAFEVMSDNTLFLTWPSGRREERRGKITSRLTRFYGARPADTPQAMAEPTREEIAGHRHDQDGQTCPMCGRVGNGEG